MQHQQPVSPPHAQVDESPLHNAIDKNKQSLKVKLMLRRPRNQLVEQGIMPPLKSPPAYHEQRQKLERAKMGDLLKAKIQQRPDRQELIRQHILDADTDHLDPSLAEKQRQLKKCKLADQLNDQLSHRPGPLELIKKNILHTDEPIERAVKEGHIEFKATSEGQSTKPVPPDHYMLDEDSSSLSPAGREASSPPESSPPPSHLQQVAPGIVTVLLTPIALANGSSLYATATTTAAPSPSSCSAASSSSPRPSPAPTPSSKSQRKKSKTKQLPKTRQIKFHEYKGPPSAQKTGSSSSCSSSSSSGSGTVETPYELMLQQQQLFLQWQLEWQHKYPQIILPAPSTTSSPTSLPTSGTDTGGGGSTSGPSASPIASSNEIPSPASSCSVPPPPPLPQTPPPHPPPVKNLEDMKVSDLRAELKRRNLPVSGPKPQLIERLKPYSDVVQVVSPSATDDSQSAIVSVVTPISTVDRPIVEDCDSVSLQSHDQESIIRQQQRKIDELQRQLQHQLQSQHNTFQVEQVEKRNAKASLAAFLQQHQAIHHQQDPPSQPAIINNNNNIIQNNNNNNNMDPTLNNKHLFAVDPSLILNEINLKDSSQNQLHRTVTLPNFVGTFINGNIDVINSNLNAVEKTLFDIKPELIKQEPMEEVKSQTVDDVLEILIKNGELPESALEGLELTSGGQLEMDVDQELMDVDTDWLDSLVDDTTSGLVGGTLGGAARRGDPLLPQATPSSPVADLFMDDSDLPLSPGPHVEFTWDRVDFAT